MQTKDFWYDLPETLIAQHPLEKRDSSRLLVMDKQTGKMEHKYFCDILEYLQSGDCLVLNNTRVIPARLIGEKEGTHGKIEIVLLKKRSNDEWEVLVKPGKKAKIGTWFTFGNGLLRAQVTDILDEGNRSVHFYYNGIWEEVLDIVGIMPLPPYITASLEDKERYQTVYSKWKGSAAAPTAGLHFTTELLNAVKERGVEITEVTLHVGLGTFRPVKVDNIHDHHMHTEWFSIDQDACNKMMAAKKNGKRIVAVGTTSVRVLETVASKGITDTFKLEPMEGDTSIFIYPGYHFLAVDAIITNFHLPESTLLMLVSAFSDKEKVMAAYQEAVQQNYRFFSFGDAMFLY